MEKKEDSFLPHNYKPSKVDNFEESKLNYLNKLDEGAEEIENKIKEYKIQQGL